MLVFLILNEICGGQLKARVWPALLLCWRKTNHNLFIQISEKQASINLIEETDFWKNNHNIYLSVVWFNKPILYLNVYTKLSWAFMEWNEWNRLWGNWKTLFEKHSLKRIRLKLQLVNDNSNTHHNLKLITAYQYARKCILMYLFSLAFQHTTEMHEKIRYYFSSRQRKENSEL